MTDGLRHVGMFANTGRKCVIVLLQTYDENGRVTNPNQCWAIDTDALEDRYHQQLMSLVRDRRAQQLTEIAPLLERTLSETDGLPLFQSLNTGRWRIQPHPIDNIVMTPKNSIRLPLRKVLEAMGRLKTQENYADNSLQESFDRPGSKYNPYVYNMSAEELDMKRGQAQNLVAQAQDLEQQAQALRARASTFDMNVGNNESEQQQYLLQQNPQAPSRDESPIYRQPGLKLDPQTGRQLRVDQFSTAQDVMYGERQAAAQNAPAPYVPEAPTFGAMDAYNQLIQKAEAEQVTVQQSTITQPPIPVMEDVAPVQAQTSPITPEAQMSELDAKLQETIEAQLKSKSAKRSRVKKAEVDANAKVANAKREARNKVAADAHAKSEASKVA